MHSYSLRLARAVMYYSRVIALGPILVASRPPLVGLLLTPSAVAVFPAIGEYTVADERAVHVSV